MSIFKINQKSKISSARLGLLKTAHGEIETPFFMPIGTYGAVKTQSSAEIKHLPSNILLSNTYHLYIKPDTNIFFQRNISNYNSIWRNPIIS